MDVKLEEVEVKDEAESLSWKGPEDHGFAELRERVQLMEKRCMGLECEIQKVNGNCKALEARNRALEVEKHEIETELLDTRRENGELKERIARLENGQINSSVKNTESDAPKFVDLTEGGEDTVFQLMIENKALECEKQKAERDAKLWKGKLEELVLWVSQREEKVLEELFRSSDISGLSLRKEIMDLRRKLCGEIHSNLGRQVRKRLVFETDDGPISTRKMAPPTPGVAKPVPTGTINIVDSDDDDDDVKINSANLPSHTQIQNPGNSKSSDSAKEVSSVLTPKRKRASRVVSSDGDSGDDGVPISRLKKLHVDADEEDDLESDGVKSDSEGESLDGFIVSDGDDASTELQDVSCGELEDDSDSESDDLSNSEMDFEKVISMVRRRRDCKPSEWKFEGDMLAAFGKDPELCMKAVCALYRQQTADERVSKETFYSNGRGFSKFDAPRGSKLGDFLTEGDPGGDLKKSVEELQEHDPKAVELCRTLATHYSKQLFEIYQNKEDPFFLPR